MKKIIFFALLMCLPMTWVRPVGTPVFDWLNNLLAGIGIGEDALQHGENIAKAGIYIKLLKDNGEKLQALKEKYEKISFEFARAREVLQCIKSLENIIRQGAGIVQYVAQNSQAFDVYSAMSMIDYSISLMLATQRIVTDLPKILTFKGTDIQKMEAIRTEQRKVGKIEQQLSRISNMCQIMMGNHSCLQGINSSFRNIQNDYCSPMIEMAGIYDNGVGGGTSELMEDPFISFEMCFMSDAEISAITQGRPAISRKKPPTDSPLDTSPKSHRSYLMIYYLVCGFAGLFGAFKVYTTIMYDGGQDVAKHVGIWSIITIFALLFGFLLENVFFT